VIEASLSKMNEFSRSQTITFTSKVVVSKNGARQKHGNNRPVTKSDLSMSKSSNFDDLGCIYFKVIYRLQSFLNGMIRSCKIYTDSASCCPSAIAELLVVLCSSFYCLLLWRGRLSWHSLSSVCGLISVSWPHYKWIDIKLGCCALCQLRAHVQ